MAPERGRCVYVVESYSGDRLCGLRVWRNHQGRLTCPLGHIRSEIDHRWIERLDGLFLVTMERMS